MLAPPGRFLSGRLATFEPSGAALLPVGLPACREAVVLGLAAILEQQECARQAQRVPRAPRQL